MQQYLPRGAGTVNSACEPSDLLESTRGGRRLGSSHSLRTRPLGDPTAPGPARPDQVSASVAVPATPMVDHRGSRSDPHPARVPGPSAARAPRLRAPRSARLWPLHRARFWDAHAAESFNKRQRKALNRLLDSFDGRLTSSRWARINHCSQDSANRGIRDLLDLVPGRRHAELRISRDADVDTPC